jgi:hypothetical protein
MQLQPFIHYYIIHEIPVYMCDYIIYEMQIYLDHLAYYLHSPKIQKICYIFFHKTSRTILVTKA